MPTTHAERNGVGHFWRSVIDMPQIAREKAFGKLRCVSHAKRSSNTFVTSASCQRSDILPASMLVVERVAVSM